MDKIEAKIHHSRAMGEMLASVNELLKAHPHNQDLLDTKADLEKDLARERKND